MIIRPSSGWQTILADLALILFLITVQQVGNFGPAELADKGEAQPEIDESSPAPVSSSALAVHRPGQNEDISEWLTATDTRQLATISVSYAPERRTEAIAEGERLMANAASAGIAARLIATPNVRDEIVISVDFLRTPGDGTILAE